MRSLPAPPKVKSPVPRPRISSSPSLPSRLSCLSVPERGPPLGQPGRSFVVRVKPFLKVRGSSQRPCSCLVPSVCPCSFLEVCPCSFLEVSERFPEQPTTMRRTAQPITKALTTTAMRCPWRTTAPSTSLYMFLATDASKHATQRTLAHLCTGLFT